MSANLDTIILNSDQDNACNAFVQFLCDPEEHIFVLGGYSGTGKSTLIRTILDRLPNYVKAAKLVNPSYPDYTMQLTATTNKAAEMFATITGQEVRTIHSFLELSLFPDHATGIKQLAARRKDNPKMGYLLFIDEASFIDQHLLKLIFQNTRNCKIVFIGDKAQLLAPKSMGAPVFMAGFKGAMLEQVMRQMVDGKPQENPISDLATLFRHTVNTGEWPSFKPDGHYVRHVSREDFEQLILREFSRPDWAYHDSKVLAFTNNCVIDYNKAIRNHVAGDPHLQVGDYAECNSFIQVGSASIKTDQLVYISGIEPDNLHHNVMGNFVTLDYNKRVFFPKSRLDKTAVINEARRNNNYGLVREAENWIDLRSVYAQTVNKSQGSTYRKVFIDLDNIKTCLSANQMARMMYVGVSRASEQVILTGDLV